MVDFGFACCLVTCHFLDGSSVELKGPLVAYVSPIAVMSLLQSTIRITLKTFFGDTNLYGPLLITYWFRGHVQLGDGGYIIYS